MCNHIDMQTHASRQGQCKHAMDYISTDFGVKLMPLNSLNSVYKHTQTTN